MLDMKKHMTQGHKMEFRNVTKGLKDNVVFDPLAPLSILYFKSGSLHADFPDCRKYPGIYGTLWMPVKLLDELYIEDGLNASDVRFAAQFRLNQITLDRLLQNGGIITLCSDLSIIVSRE